jgi:hypothetical protein
MKTTLVKGVAVAGFDAKILEIVQAEEFDGGGHNMTFGIRNEAGAIYRRITMTGLTELMGVVTALQRAGFVDELADSTRMKDGCDGIWSKS